MLGSCMVSMNKEEISAKACRMSPAESISARNRPTISFAVSWMTAAMISSLPPK